jgi:hypothetical protein
MFIRMTELNSWYVLNVPLLLMILKIVLLRRSHATYYFLAAGMPYGSICYVSSQLTTSGCHISLRNTKKARELLDAIPGLLDKRKVGGKELPFEVVIKKKSSRFCYSSTSKRLTHANSLIL